MSSPTPRIVEIAHGTAEYAATVELRRRWLREPLGLEFSEEELAGEHDAYHLACYVGEELVGCAVLRPWEGQAVRMRQLIVHPDFQRRGIGRALIEQSEALARRHGYSEIVLFARETAVEFYRRLGYEEHGEPFLEIGIPHLKMTKALG